MTEDTAPPRLDFVRQAVSDDVQSGRFDGTVVTRFPPEPNGFLHIGHAKAISLDFGVAEQFGGRCHLRFDDTNPTKEEQRFADAMKDDIRWLGFEWGEHEFHASDYFEQLYDFAVRLIKSDRAFVCDLDAEAMRSHRGTLTEPGRPSPHRDRSVDENLDLFRRMKEGEFEDGSRTLRAKIDMAAPNVNLRDPVMYRILRAPHPRTGSTWCIYPTYDWAHGQSDSIEGVTHSLCSLEFEDHRPLYDWYLEALELHHPRQIEFSRLDLTYTIVTKRKLRRLIEENLVSGWDDPRLPTLVGMRRRGYTAAAIRALCEKVGVTKFKGFTDVALLESCLRDDLNHTSPRAMGVLDPLKVVIENYPEGETEEFDAANNPAEPDAGTRRVPFGREIYIERGDFMEDPPRKFFRLGPGREVRLRFAYFITCTDVVKNDAGEIIEVRCTYDPATRGGDAPDGRKVKGTLHWVSAAHAVPAEVRLYDRLFSVEHPEKTEEGGDFVDHLNPDSLQVVEGLLEPSLLGREPGARLQLERIGYFCIDPDSTPERPVLNRTVALRDHWAKMAAARA